MSLALVLRKGITTAVECYPDNNVSNNRLSRLKKIKISDYCQLSSIYKGLPPQSTACFVFKLFKDTANLKDSDLDGSLNQLSSDESDPNFISEKGSEEINVQIGSVSSFKDDIELNINIEGNKNEWKDDTAE